MGALKVLVRHRRLAAALHFALALAMLPGILHLQNDNSPEVFFTRDAAAMEQYRRFCREFGGGKAVRVALSGSGLWAKQGLAWLSELEKQADSLPGVEAAVGLAAYYRWHSLEWPPPDAALFRSRMLEGGLDLFTGLVSPDGETVTLLVVFADLAPGAERELLHRLYELIARTPSDIRAHLSGLPVLHLAMDRSLVNTAARFLPLLVLLAVVFLAVIFRRWWDVMVPILFVAVCQSILFGIMGYAGARLNMVNIILAPILFVISLATAVHLLMRFRDISHGGETVSAAVLATYRSKGWPVLWTGFTTLAAFGSLVTASLPPLRSLGLWSALGIAVMTVLAFTLFPTLLASVRWKAAPQPARPFELWAQRRGRIWAGWAVRHRFPAVGVTAALLAAGLLGIAQLRVEDNLARYFPAHHPVRVELERLQQQGVGVFAAELVLSFRESKSNAGTVKESGFQNPWSQQRLAGLSRRLRSDPLVYGALNSGELVEAVIRSLLVEGEVNDSIRWMALGLMQMVPESRKLLRALVTEDGQSARVTLLLPMVGVHQMQPLFERIKTEAARFFPTAETWITGQYPLILLAQRTLLRGLIAALSVTLLCVVIVFLLVLRSVRLTFLVLVPNLWPVVVVLGGMGWLKFPLDSASVMTAAIVLGLAVDDTFHTMGHFQRVVSRSTPAAAIEATLERIAPAHILTSVILIAGFAACSFSDLLPVSRLGVLSVVAIALALVGDLLLIPALLTLYQNSKSKRKQME